jgi:hypothetical protein
MPHPRAFQIGIRSAKYLVFQEQNSIADDRLDLSVRYDGCSFRGLAAQLLRTAPTDMPDASRFQHHLVYTRFLDRQP